MTRRTALSFDRRALDGPAGPPTGVAGGRNHNRPKEVEMDAHAAGRAGRLIPLVALAAGLLFLVALVAVPDAAFAASKIGKNVGNEIETWGKAILLGVVALVAIPVLLKRDMAGGAAIAGLSVLVGGFVFAPGAVKDVISGLWRSVGG